jgi:hypothetical protein
MIQVEQAKPNTISITGDNQAEALGAGINRTWLDNHTIAFFTAEAATRAAVDIWAEAVKGVMASTPPDRPWMMMHDFTADRNGLTPYARARAQEVMAFRPEARGYAAIIMRNNVMGQAVSLFMRLAAMRRSNVEARVFFRRDDALTWLRQKAQSARQG